MPHYRRILVPVDGSPTSNTALTSALQLARDVGGRVRLLHCVDELAYALTGYEYVGDMPVLLRQEGERILADAAEIAKSAGVEAETHLVERMPQRLGETVAEDAAAWGADLVVVGSHGRRGLRRLLLGSGAEQIVRLAPTPVLVVRSDARG